MNRDVVLFGSRGEGEWVPLPVGNLRAGEEDVLPGTRLGIFFLDLDLHDLGRVLNDLGNIGDMP